MNTDLTHDKKSLDQPSSADRPSEKEDTLSTDKMHSSAQEAGDYHTGRVIGAYLLLGGMVGGLILGIGSILVSMVTELFKGDYSWQDFVGILISWLVNIQPVDTIPILLMQYMAVTGFGGVPATLTGVLIAERKLTKATEHYLWRAGKIGFLATLAVYALFMVVMLLISGVQDGFGDILNLEVLGFFTSIIVGLSLLGAVSAMLLAKWFLPKSM